MNIFEIEAAMLEAGFEVIEVETVGDNGAFDVVYLDGFQVQLFDGKVLVVNDDE